ncbi:carboxypeptidase B-like [Ptychodera flava]|uniref:carboxypeptidase B-like n=1 Tax=Ptychodera flava TaxID=63121 RepID=UPI00396A865D
MACTVTSVWLALWSLLIATTMCEAVDHASYDGYKVLRIYPKQSEHIAWISKWRELSGTQVDFWREPSKPGREVDVMLSPIQARKFEGALQDFNISYDVTILDVQKLIDEQLKQKPAGDGAKFDYSKYHTYNQIQDWLKDMATQYSDLASILEVTTSFEGRKVRALKVGKTTPGAEKPAVWIEGGIHAREWISPATVLYITKELLERYGKNRRVTRLLNTFDWYILPVFNVDGYSYSWSSDRMWRKTRTKNENSTCVGVDPNRNWDIHWGEEGASHFPCSDTYCGPFPFSAPSVRGVADFIKSIPNVVAFLDIHSYSQMWMSPWGFTHELPPDFDIQDALSKAAVRALESVHGTKYTHGTIANTLTIASGSSADWTYAESGANIVYSYAVELRDTGRFGFLLPPDQIVPSGQETFAAVVATGVFILNNPPPQ